MSEKTITLTRNELFRLILRYENEVTCAKELPVLLDRVMNGNDETAEIDYDAQGMDNDKGAESDGKRGCLSLPLSARIGAISKAKERSRKRKPKHVAIVAGIGPVEQGQFEQGEI